MNKHVWSAASMTQRFCSVIAAAALLVPIGANAAIIATVDFTGVITESAGNFASTTVGATVSGIYTFNFADANLGIGSSPIGSDSDWSVYTGNGTSGYPGPLAFTSTMNIGSSVFNRPTVTLSPSDQLDKSSVSYLQTSPSNYYTAAAIVVDADGNETNSNIQLYQAPGGLLPFLSNGLPTLAAGVQGQGQLDEPLADGSVGIIDYQLTSLTVASIQEVSPVPLPASAWLMLSGLGGIGALARKKHAA